MDKRAISDMISYYHNEPWVAHTLKVFGYAQGIAAGDIRFDDAEALAEIVLIVLTVKMDDTLAPASREQNERTIRALISLLEKGTENPPGSLNFLMS